MLDQSLRDRLLAWRDLYVQANRGTLEWMLDRPPLHGVFLNTKFNHITHQDFQRSDGWRGPQIILGWIQGRGLEALVTHAAFFDHHDPALAQRIDDAGRRLYQALSQLFLRAERGFFAYDQNLRPVFPDKDGVVHPQICDVDVTTFSDIFIVKGLMAAASRYQANDLPLYEPYWQRIIDQIKAHRFIRNERQVLSVEALSQEPKDYSPKMIMISGAALLKRLGLEAQSAFGLDFIDDLLRHYIKHSAFIDAPIMTDEQNGILCNPGHAIEFSGFSLDYLASEAPSERHSTLVQLLANHFKLGFEEPGILLKVNGETGERLSPYFPWWPLPETIRAVSLAYASRQDEPLLAIWERAHQAFFKNFWQGTPAIATQTRTKQGPVDFVPSTSDLDPGYHTGLSLLVAIEAIDQILTNRASS